MPTTGPARGQGVCSHPRHASPFFTDAGLPSGRKAETRPTRGYAQGGPAHTVDAARAQAPAVQAPAVWSYLPCLLHPGVCVGRGLRGTGQDPGPLLWALAAFPERSLADPSNPTGVLPPQEGPGTAQPSDAMGPERHFNSATLWTPMTCPVRAKTWRAEWRLPASREPRQSRGET